MSVALIRTRNVHEQAHKSFIVIKARAMETLDEKHSRNRKVCSKIWEGTKRRKAMSDDLLAIPKRFYASQYVMNNDFPARFDSKTLFSIKSKQIVDKNAKQSSIQWSARALRFNKFIMVIVRMRGRRGEKRRSENDGDNVFIEFTSAETTVMKTENNSCEV